MLKKELNTFKLYYKFNYNLVNSKLYLINTPGSQCLIFNVSESSEMG